MEQFLTWVSGIFDVEASQLSLETAYESMPQWDSMMQLRLVMEMEEEYDIEIPMEKIPQMKTLGDFYEYVK